MKMKLWKQCRFGEVLACASMLLFTACANTAPDGSESRNDTPAQEGTLVDCNPIAGSVTVCGIAVDDNGMPLGGATARLGGAQFTTAADGSFSVSAAAGPTLTFTLSAPNFMPLSTNVYRDVLGRTFGLARLHTQMFPGPMMVNVLDPRTGAGVQQLDLNSLYDPATGGPAKYPVTVGVRYLDPNEVAMPGDDGAIDRNGVRVFLRSFGVTYVEVRDASMRLLQLRTGTQARIIIPITNDRLPVAPPNIALWTQQPGSGTWREQPNTAQQQPAQGPRECNGTSRSCDSDNCTNISPANFAGPITSLGFVNADIRMTNSACLRIVVDGSQLPPGSLPVCLDIQIPVPGAGTQTRMVCAGDGTTVLYNIPDNVDLVISQAGMPLGCATPPPSSSATVNTGAPWGGSDRPSNPSLCNSELVIPPLP